MTPTTNDKKNESPTPNTKKQLRLEARPFKAKKLTTQLQATNFCDIGNLSNAISGERVKVIALAMLNRLGTFDPSNEYIQNYKHKDILDE